MLWHIIYPVHGKRWQLLENAEVSDQGQLKQMIYQWINDVAK